jgi:hypothetical protein
MSNSIQINSISGNPPYDIYVCDQTISYCYLVTGSTLIPTPYLFDVPSPLDSTTPIILKLVDSLGCEKIFLLSCSEIYAKQYEDFQVFLFQDASIYLFEGL